MNLLKETIEKLEECGKTFDDVRWIGNKSCYVDIEQFKKIADTDYDDGYGSQKVAEDLLIVGDDWYLERGEYDGSEWYSFNRLPDKPSVKMDLRALTVNQAKELGIRTSCGWEDLKTINGWEVWDKEPTGDPGEPFEPDSPETPFLEEIKDIYRKK